MNEVISEDKKRVARKHKKANLAKKKLNQPVEATASDNLGYSVETTQDMNAAEAMDIKTSVMAPEWMPENWDMSMDSMVRLLDDILYVEDKVVVKNTGLKGFSGEPIGESSVEKEVVKSSVKFGEIVHQGKNTNFKRGDIIALNGAAAKPIDFDKRFAIVPHFMIYGKIVRKGEQPEKSNSKNLLRRFLQRFFKWMGFGNVHQPK